MSARLSNWIAARRAAGAAVVLVTVAQARGSAPRDAGTVMAVTADALSGTIVAAGWSGRRWRGRVRFLPRAAAGPTVSTCRWARRWSSAAAAMWC